MKSLGDFTTIGTMRFLEWRKSLGNGRKFESFGDFNDVKFALRIRPHWSGGRPHNKPIELSPGGRQAFCLRKSLADSAPVLSLRERTIAPSSQLIGALYGR